MELMVTPPSNSDFKPPLADFLSDHFRTCGTASATIGPLSQTLDLFLHGLGQGDGFANRYQDGIRG
jgi:hypothetical protein